MNVKWRPEEVVDVVRRNLDGFLPGRFYVVREGYLVTAYAYDDHTFDSVDLGKLEQQLRQFIAHFTDGLVLDFVARPVPNAILIMTRPFP
jgi:hypothetical protein